jgi:hypothetical protein
MTWRNHAGVVQGKVDPTQQLRKIHNHPGWIGVKLYLKIWINQSNWIVCRQSFALFDKSELIIDECRNVNF